MAKKSMNLKYKAPKREKNKKVVENEEAGVKNFVFTLIGVLAFIGLVYLGVFGLSKIGLFDAGYTAPSKEETVIDYEYISMGTVFNRSESTYYVVFDNYEDEYSSDVYVNYLLDSQSKYKTYKVDMSKKENEEYVSTKSNHKAKKVSDLKINGLTLIKISKGKIVKYLEGNADIEEYLNK